jgi:hypothetical protein
MTLRGERMAEEFQEIVQDYIETRFGGEANFSLSRLFQTLSRLSLRGAAQRAGRPWRHVLQLEKS